MSLVTTIALALKTVQTLADTGFGAQTDSALFPFSGVSLASGTAANQADLVYRAKRTLASAAADSLDLSGSLTDIFGTTLVNARIKCLAIYNANTAAGDNLIIGAAASNPWEGWTTQTGSKITVGPGGLLLLFNPSAAGMPVTAATADILKVLNSSSGSNSIDYYIVAVGASA